MSFHSFKFIDSKKPHVVFGRFLEEGKAIFFNNDSEIIANYSSKIAIFRLNLLALNIIL